jgi:type II secretory pathway component PulF
VPSFRWSAVNPGGDVARGVMEAPDRAAESEMLLSGARLEARAREKANGKEAHATITKMAPVGQ